MSITLEVRESIDFEMRDIARGIVEEGENELADLLEEILCYEGKGRMPAPSGYSVGESLGSDRVKRDVPGFFLEIVAGCYGLDESTDGFVKEVKSLAEKLSATDD